MAITEAQAQAKLDAYYAAETAILTGQEYRLGNRWLTRADLRAVQDGITLWEMKLSRIQRGGIRITGVTPC